MFGESTGGERGVSSPLGYVLNLSIAAIALVSLGAAGAVFFDANADAALEEDLRTFGNELAGDIQSVDRLAARTPSTRAVDERSAIGDAVRGTDYVVEVVNASAAAGPPGDASVEHADRCDRRCLVLLTRDGDVQTTVNFVSATPVESTRFDGGPVAVRRPAGSNTIRFEPLDT